MLLDAEAAETAARARVASDQLAELGGRCDVAGGVDGDGYENHRFVVELADGRVFTGCGIHGSGGMLRGAHALERARQLVAHQSDPFPDVRLYLVSRWWGDVCLSVRRSSIVRVKQY